MDLEKIPYEIQNASYDIKENECNIDFINNLDVFCLSFDKIWNSIKYNIDIDNCLIDHEYIIFNNYSTCHFSFDPLIRHDYVKGNNTIGLYKYKLQYDNIINQNYITSLKIYLSHINFKDNIKLINNLPKNIENLYIIISDNVNINEINNLPLTLKNINIYKYFIDNIITDIEYLENILNIKISFHCSINLFIANIYGNIIIYKNLQKYK